MPNLAIGTAQFGLNYGISNTLGQTSKAEIDEIIRHAATNQVDVIDTSPAYGSSEELLGEFLPSSFGSIVTKTLQLKTDALSVYELEKIEATFNLSLKKLRRQKIYGLLVHDAEDLLKPGADALYAWLKEIQANEQVLKIGVSVYTPDQIDLIFSRYELDLVQLPISVFDQRFVLNGQLKYLKALGVEIHARSIFLQGLLLMNSTKLSKHFDPIKPIFDLYDDYLEQNNLSPLQAAYAFVNGLDQVDEMVCGVNTLEQFHELLSLKMKKLPQDFFGQFSIENHSILNPAEWV